MSTQTPTLATITATTLAVLQQRVYEVSAGNGWYDTPRTRTEGLALIHGEVSEILDAYRDWGLVDATGATCRVQAHKGMETCKPEGVPAEMADVAMYLLDEMRRRGKTTFVDYRPEDVLAGVGVAEFVVQMHRLLVVGDELEPALALLCSYAFALRIDLVAEIEQKMTYNRTRGHRHGGKIL